MTCIISQPTPGGISRIECDEHEDVPGEVFTDRQAAVTAYTKHWADVKGEQVEVNER